MILIADSGSTKTSWCLISSENKTEFFITSGINPYFRSSEDIYEELKFKLLPEISVSVKGIYFYGAGIINNEEGKVVKNALTELFPEAVIETNSDLLAAARATLKNKKGIACILGTGSNSCLFDGEKIIEHVPPLGFILGDEGSGAVLGKKLLADYLKGILPEKLAEKFQKEFSYSYSEYLQKVYKQEQPNKFLASLIPFIHKNLDEKYCKDLVSNSFSEFVERNISQYTGFQNQPICFVGSVAFYFAEILKVVLQNNGLEIGIILKDPMEGLIQFHSKQ